MKNNMRALICLCFLLLATKAECQLVGKGRTYAFTSTKIYSAMDSCVNTKGTFNYYNISIPQAYYILDTLELPSSTILVLACKALNYRTEYTCNENYNERLLIFLDKKGDKYTIRFINEKVIPNPRDYMNEPYKGLEKTKDGFLMKVATGSIIKCEYKVHFKKSNSKYYLSTVKYDCYKTDFSNAQEGKKLHSISTTKELSRVVLKKYLYQPDM